MRAAIIILAAVAEVGGTLGLAWVDISTGDFAVQPLAPAELAGALARLAPSEILLPDRLFQRAELAAACWPNGAAQLSPLPGGALRERGGAPAAGGELRRSRRWMASAASSGPRSPPAGALVDYLQTTQLGTLPRLAAAAAPRLPARSWRSMRRRGAISN